MKTRYKVAGKAIRKDDSVDHNFVGYTCAVSKKKAVSNLQYRHGVLLRDVRVEEVMPIVGYKQQTLV